MPSGNGAQTSKPTLYSHGRLERATLPSETIAGSVPAPVEAGISVPSYDATIVV